MSDIDVQNRTVFLPLKSSNITRINDPIFVTAGGFSSDLKVWTLPELVGSGGATFWEDLRSAFVPPWFRVSWLGPWVTVSPHTTQEAHSWVTHASLESADKKKNPGCCKLSHSGWRERKRRNC